VVEGVGPEDPAALSEPPLAVSPLLPSPLEDPLSFDLSELALAFLIIRAPVVGGIKTRAFKYQSCTCSNQTLHLPFTPDLLPAQLLRANRIRRVVHRLEGIKCLITLFALIFVGGHR
jgi:hypothetical protein